MKEMERDKTGGILCPWCPKKNNRSIFIADCIHDPFKLMIKIEQLENEVYSSHRAALILQDLKDYLSEK
jgi:hypothetical protein